MRIIKIKGGLGNQLFQYAFARSVGLITNEKIILDTSLYLLSKERSYSLDLFKTNNFKTISFFPIYYLYRFIFKLNKYIPFLFKNFYFENYPCNFNSKLPSNKFYFDGYFQSEKYFINYKSLILKEFNLSKSLDSKYLKLIENNLNSVSIHIRRGDYLNIKNKSLFVTFSLDYYFSAIKLIYTKVKDPFFFIFSDDINWCKQNFNIVYPHTFIVPSTPEKDLILMSKCKHQIIANSSYSWWGAWLNQNENKIVIAPKKWMNLDIIYFKDICPDSWIRI